VLGEPRVVRLTAGLRRPRRPIRGADLAGRVEAVGRDVTRFRVGDEVFGMDTAGGGFAEYAAVDADVLVPKPTVLTLSPNSSTNSPQLPCSPAPLPHLHFVM
jgi:NADPH:quinone reductase-like Zn-dependent oxidoreductase